MITLFASIAGFIGSIFPELIKLLRDKHDKKHELEILDRQIEMQKSCLNQRLNEIVAYGDIVETRAIYKTYKTGIHWVDALNASVRPVLAYSFFLIYAIVKLLEYLMIGSDAPLSVYLDIIWTQDDQAIFAGIISFYFGQRTISKLRGKK